MTQAPQDTDQTNQEREARRLGAEAAFAELIAGLYRAHPHGLEALEAVDARLKIILAPGGPYDNAPQAWHDAVSKQIEFVRARVKSRA